MKYIDEKIDIIITNDGSHSLYNKDLNETYHSRHGAIKESEYVYIEQGLDYISRHFKKSHIKIFELGFGTGSNFLLTVNYLLAHPELSVEYTTLEKYPISPGLISQMNYEDYCVGSIAKHMYQQAHILDWNSPHMLSKQLAFTKVHADIHEYTPEPGIGLVYYDAFAPSKQQDIWDLSVLSKIEKNMSAGAVLVTYCSQGEFKRKLKTLGLQVTTLDGPPFKKEMVRASKVEI